MIDGIGFPATANVTAIDVIDGQKLGWALGSTLYEINTLPWEFEGSLQKRIDDSDDSGDASLAVDSKNDKRHHDKGSNHAAFFSEIDDGATITSLEQNQGVSLILFIVLATLVATAAFRRRRRRVLYNGRERMPGRSSIDNEHGGEVIGVYGSLESRIT